MALCEQRTWRRACEPCFWTLPSYVVLAIAESVPCVYSVAQNSMHVLLYQRWWSRCRYASIDLVCDRLARKLRKVKDKAISKGKWQGRGGPRGSNSIKQDDVSTMVFDSVLSLTTLYHNMHVCILEEPLTDVIIFLQIFVKSHQYTLDLAYCMSWMFPHVACAYKTEQMLLLIADAT